MKKMTREKQARVFAFGSLVLFLFILGLENAINSSLDPTTHRISEYVNGDWGWLMSLGFGSWAFSLAATAYYLCGFPRGGPVFAGLLIAAVGMTITACFATQTSAGRLPPGESLTLSGQLHDFGSGLATLALAGAVLSSLRLESKRLRRCTAALLVVAIAVGVLIFAGGEAPGIRQRLLVLFACLWQAGLLTLKTTRVDGTQASPTSGSSPSIR
jgi:hypothetical protein